MGNIFSFWRAQQQLRNHPLNSPAPCQQVRPGLGGAALRAGPGTLPKPRVSLHAFLPSALSILGQLPARLAGGGASVWVGPMGAGSRDLGRSLPDYRGSTPSPEEPRRGRGRRVLGAFLAPPPAPPHCGVLGSLSRWLCLVESWWWEEALGPGKCPGRLGEAFVVPLTVGKLRARKACF